MRVPEAEFQLSFWTLFSFRADFTHRDLDVTLEDSKRQKQPRSFKTRL